LEGGDAGVSDDAFLPEDRPTLLPDGGYFSAEEAEPREIARAKLKLGNKCRYERAATRRC
jgi:hypothetical protein